MEKICKNCNITKPESEFYTKGNGGLSTLCKKCTIQQTSDNRKKRGFRSPETPNGKANHAIYLRGWQKRNRDKIKLYHKKHLLKDIERSRLLSRLREERRLAKLRIENPEKLKVIYRERYARRKARILGTQIGKVSYQNIVNRNGMVCGICSQEVLLSDLSFDHIIPLARGGDHIEENLQVAHRKCNSSKGARWSL